MNCLNGKINIISLFRPHLTVCNFGLTFVLLGDENLHAKRIFSPMNELSHWHN
jgi:hypothetical protein